MSKFDLVKNDDEIIKIYSEISLLEDDSNAWAHHDFNHVMNVANLVEKLLRDLDYDDEFIDEAKIAAILHDTGCLEGKDGHSFRGYEFARRYFEEKDLDLKNEDLILEAIKIHSDGFDTDNVMALTLILADKLDVKHTRIAKEGYNIVGNRQFQYVNDILVSIKENVLEINFLCDVKLNRKELEDYYFMKKVFKAIKAFSNKMNLRPSVLLNGNSWPMFDLI